MIPETSEPSYAAADTTLWLFPALVDYDQAAGDDGFVRHTVYPLLGEIIDWHFRGTHFGIQVDPKDCLLSAGDGGTPLTWMNVRSGGRPLTPRYGKAVDINALWINALGTARMFAAKYGSATDRKRFQPWVRKAHASFVSRFWDAKRGYLADCVIGDMVDPSLRPNQIFAVSLPFVCLADEIQRAVVSVVERDLLTPVGLRTLSPRDPRYKGQYRGSPETRDAALHQGTVWPWLMGPYLAAHHRVFGDAAYCKEKLARFRAETARGCLGHIAELYTGDAPHRPCGAPAQAWSLTASL